MKHVTYNINYYHKKKGFTLLEILIAVSVFVILTLITTNSFRSFQDTQALNSVTEQIMSSIDETRFNTISSKKSLRHGVHFETNKIVIYEGDTYSESDPNNKEIILSQLVEISNISLEGGGSNLLFQKITGETNNYGTITLRNRRDLTKTKTIKIEKTGITSI